MADDRDENGIYTGPGEITIPFVSPVKRKGQDDLTSITLQEPTGKQLSIHAEKLNSTNDDGISATMLLISLVSGVIPPDVEAMKQRDLDACGFWLANFTRRKPKVDSPA